MSGAFKTDGGVLLCCIVCSLCVFDESASSSQKNFFDRIGFSVSIGRVFRSECGLGLLFDSRLIAIDVRTVVA